jgi:antitoxin component of MazEF toxin-antitoxin module
MFGKRIKVREIGGNLTMTIPRDVGLHFGIVRGTELDVFCQDEKLIVDLTSGQRSRLFDPPAKAVEPVATEPAVAETTAA